MSAPLTPQVEFELENGATRILDYVNDVDAIGYEVKTGLVSMSPNVQMQIIGAQQIVQSGQLNAIEYHFLTSPITGQIGAADSVLSQLTASGIKYMSHSN
jgi:hypothetical protein